MSYICNHHTYNMLYLAPLTNTSEFHLYYDIELSEGPRGPFLEFKSRARREGERLARGV